MTCGQILKVTGWTVADYGFRSSGMWSNLILRWVSQVSEVHMAFILKDAHFRRPKSPVTLPWGPQILQ